jgi:hypothetical protein
MNNILFNYSDILIKDDIDKLFNIFKKNIYVLLESYINYILIST